MYICKRFRTSRLSVIIILITLALIAWEVLGPTGTLLAKKGGDEKATYKVDLLIEGNHFSGMASWQTLDVAFPDNDIICVNSIELDLFQMSLKMKAGKIDRITLFFKDPVNEKVYQTWQNNSDWLDVKSINPEIGVGFEIEPIDPSADLRSGRREEPLGSVDVNVATYIPQP